MKTFTPRKLILAGLLLVVGGFVYDVVFAGIPYQDVPQELLDRYDLHKRVASVVCGLGLLAIACGCCLGIAQKLRRNRD